MAIQEPLPLPREWPQVVQSGVPHAISLASAAVTTAWARASAAQRDRAAEGHEPLDTDRNANFEGEVWLLTNGYCQAEGLTRLDEVPETGALVAIGLAKFGGGTGGLARFLAICPPHWPHGVSIDELSGAPMPAFDMPLRWEDLRGMRVRGAGSAAFTGVRP